MDSDFTFESQLIFSSFFQYLHLLYSPDISMSIGLSRVEVQCATCRAHIGHVFDDGAQSSALRYCVNSASLRFLQRNANSPSTNTTAPPNSPN